MNFMRPDRALSPTHLGATVLDEDALLRAAPSIFAPAKHESRSERYTYIPTIEVVRALMKEGFEPTSAKQGGSRVPGKKEFTKHMVRFRHGTAEMRQVGDTRPEIVLINSHDGTSSYRILAGLFRLACLNGMVVADGLVDDVRVGHTGDIREKVIEGTWSVVGQTKRVMEKPEQWKGITLNPPEQLALAQAAHTLRFEDTPHQARMIEPLDLNVARRAEDQGWDLWSTFNRLQENTVRGGIRRAGWVRDPETGRQRYRTVTTAAITNIDGDVKLNRALWVLAEQMAKIKEAA